MRFLSGWTAPAPPAPLPEISHDRRMASTHPVPTDHRPTEKTPEPSILYLAYGSNLCDTTFLISRGIRPLAATNVIVPELTLTFDLPGIPYTEPCFANTALRTVDKPDTARPSRGGYHKDRWTKGLVGTVYEVTPADYAHIIATEGGGASYHDVMVQCFPLPRDAEQAVPPHPGEGGFRAHTLFAPAQQDDGGRIVRSRRGYAQASARYLGLITDGARERGLPSEYREYLAGLRPYTITTAGQRMGQVLFGLLWMPFILLVFGLHRKLADEEGRVPAWVAALSNAVFRGAWASYDVVFRPVFGDGERTVGEGGGDADESWRSTGRFEDVKEVV